MTNSDSKIYHNLNTFYRKYYTNKILKGGLFFFFYMLVISSVLLLVEYLFWFNSFFRTALFYSYLLTAFGLLYFMVIDNYLKKVKLKKGITKKEAAKIIGQFFPKIQDELLNLIELQDQATENNSELLLAGIKQKSDSLVRFKFDKAVDLKENLKYLKWVLMPIIIIGSVSFFFPDIISKSSYRLINYSKDIYPKAPFNIQILSDLKAVKDKKYKLKIKLIGNSLPDRLYLKYKGQQQALYRQDKTTYIYSWNRLKENLTFSIQSGIYQFGPYQIKLFPNPLIKSMKIVLDYPKYIKQVDQIQVGSGDILAPEGTKIRWQMKTASVDDLFFILDTNKKIKANKKEANIYEYTHIAKANSSYHIVPYNKESLDTDTTTYSLRVIMDEYPQIAVNQDTTNSLSIDLKKHFEGQVTDDYGISKLTFNYEVSTKSGKKTKKIIPIKINPNSSTFQFAFSYDFSVLLLSSESRLSYYFQVWDNDQYNGAKSKKSQIFNFLTKSKEKIIKEIANTETSIKSKLENAENSTSDLNTKLSKMKTKTAEKKNINWSDKQQMKQMIDAFKAQLEEVKKQFAEQKKIQQQANQLQPSEKVEKQQEKINKLFQDDITKELAKILEELEKLLEKQAPLQQELQKKMEDLATKKSDFDKDLERTLELYKKLLLEKKLLSASDRANSLAKKQQKVIKEKDKKTQFEDQQKINKEFDELSKNIDKIDKENAQLKKPTDLNEVKKKKQATKQSLEKSQQNLEQQKYSKAKSQQEQSAQNLKSLSQSLLASASKMKDQSEDIALMKQLLTNLIYMSVEQEDIIKNIFKPESRRSYSFSDFLVRQNALKGDSRIITDSLFALSKRNENIQRIVNKEARTVLFEMDKVLENLSDTKYSSALVRQQKIMTSINRLALIIDESIQKAERVMSLSAKGSPGSGGKPKSSGKNQQKGPSMHGLQKQLNDRLNQLKEFLSKQGKGKNGGKQGEKNGDAGKQSGDSKNGINGIKESKQFSEAYNQQAKIKQKLFNQMAGEGNLERLKQLRHLQQLMSQTENDLVNKMINQQTLKRQYEILNRLLEYKKAEKEQGKEKKRESKTAQDADYNNKGVLKQEIIQLNNKESFLKKELRFAPYYQDKITKYFSVTQ